MAYKRNEIEEVVAVVDLSEFTEVRVTKIGNNGIIEAIDIRQWYCTQKDPIKQPTQKGLRISVDKLEETLLAVLSTCPDEVLSAVRNNLN